MAIAAFYLAMGLAWAGRTILEFARPQYYDPVTPLDFIAVWSYSLALGLLGLAVPLLARDAQAGRLPMVAAIVTGSSAWIAAVANGIEDGIGVAGAASWYVSAVLITLVGLIVTATLLALEGHRRAASVAGWWCAIAGVSLGVGVLVLVGSWLAARDRDRLAVRHRSEAEEGADAAASATERRGPVPGQ